MRFEAGTGDSVRIRLRVGPAVGAMGSQRECDLGERAPLVSAEVSGSVFHIDTDRSLAEDCVAEWIVSLPPLVVVEAEVTTGNISVEGLRGGIRLTSSVGDIGIRVSDGPVTAQAGVGRIDLVYLGHGFGEVSAETNVGHIELSLNGRALSRRGPPGSGDALSLEGSAENAVQLTANVGNVSIRLGEQQPGASH